MSRLFQEDGTSVPVTVISVAANFVADIKTHEKHGYSAIVVSKNTSKNLTKSSTEFLRSKISLMENYLNSERKKPMTLRLGII